jgi:hypothetical protein
MSRATVLDASVTLKFWSIKHPDAAVIVDVIAAALKAAGDVVKSPELAPVALVVQIFQVSVLSSQMRAELVDEPRSTIIPASPEGVPLVP